MDATGDEFLTHTAWPSNQDGAAAWPELGDHLEQVLGCGALGNQPNHRWNRACRGLGRARCRHLFRQACSPLMQCPIQPPLNQFELEGLLDVINRTEPHRFHRRIDRAVRRDDDDRHVRRGRPRRAQHIHPRTAGHLKIRHDCVEGRLLQQGHGLVTVGGSRHLIPPLLKRSGEEVTDAGLIVDNEQSTGWGHAGLPTGV